MTHKFRVGAVVLYRPPQAYMATQTGQYVVERQMPADSDGLQYRIESRRDGHRRVVHEINLVRASGID